MTNQGCDRCTNLADTWAHVDTIPQRLCSACLRQLRAHGRAVQTHMLANLVGPCPPLAPAFTVREAKALADDTPLTSQEPPMSDVDTPKLRPDAGANPEICRLENCRVGDFVGGKMKRGLHVRCYQWAKRRGVLEAVAAAPHFPEPIALAHSVGDAVEAAVEASTPGSVLQVSVEVSVESEAASVESEAASVQSQDLGLLLRTMSDVLGEDNTLSEEQVITTVGTLLNRVERLFLVVMGEPANPGMDHVDQLGRLIEEAEAIHNELTVKGAPAGKVIFWRIRDLSAVITDVAALTARLTEVSQALDWAGAPAGQNLGERVRALRLRNLDEPELRRRAKMLDEADTLIERAQHLRTCAMDPHVVYAEAAGRG